MIIPHIVSIPSPSFWIDLGNHLWQATMFGIFIIGVIYLLRRFPARIRFYVGWIGLLKFTLPPALIFLALSHLDRPSVISNPVISEAILPISLTLSEHLIPFEEAVPITGDKTFSNRTVFYILGIIWLSGTLSFFFLWQIKLLKLRKRLLDEAEPFSEIVSSKLIKLTNVLGIKKKISGLFVENNIQPGVYGILHPTIILPKELSREFTEKELESILIHELIHVKYRDNLWAYVQMLLFCILWFHPFVWWLNRRLKWECEKNCDEEVFKYFQDKEAYASGIFKVSKFYLNLKVAGVSGATHNRLQSRIQSILSFDGFGNPYRVFQKIIIGSLAFLLLLSTAASGFLANIEKTTELRENNIIQENSAVDIEFLARGLSEEKNVIKILASEIASPQQAEQLTHTPDMLNNEEETAYLSLEITENLADSEIEKSTTEENVEINSISSLNSTIASTSRSNIEPLQSEYINGVLTPKSDHRILDNTKIDIFTRNNDGVVNSSLNTDEMSVGIKTQPYNNSMSKNEFSVDKQVVNWTDTEGEKKSRNSYTNRSQKTAKPINGSMNDSPAKETYAWSKYMHKILDDPNAPNPIYTRRVMKAVESILSQKGKILVDYNEAASLVGFKGEIRKRKDAQLIIRKRDLGPGISHLRLPQTYKSSEDDDMYFYNIIVSDHEYGLLKIVIFDTKTNKLVWQGSGRIKATKGKKAERRIERDVSRILMKYPAVN